MQDPTRIGGVVMIDWLLILLTKFEW